MSPKSWTGLKNWLPGGSFTWQQALIPLHVDLSLGPLQCPHGTGAALRASNPHDNSKNCNAFYDLTSKVTYSHFHHSTGHGRQHGRRLVSTTNWHLSRASASDRTTKTQALAICLCRDWTLFCRSWQPSTHLREIQGREWGTLCFREMGGTGLYTVRYFLDSWP